MVLRTAKAASFRIRLDKASEAGAAVRNREIRKRNTGFEPPSVLSFIIT